MHTPLTILCPDRRAIWREGLGETGGWDRRRRPLPREERGKIKDGGKTIIEETSVQNKRTTGVMKI